MITCSLHNHCSLCDGADTLAEMAKAAFDAGITDFGISCHSRVEFDDGCVKDEDEYIETVRSFIASSPFGMNIYLGAEEDLLGEVRRRGDYDYIIGSVHYLESGGKIYSVDRSGQSFRECFFEGFGGDAKKLAESYFACVAKEVGRGVNVVGHFDLIRKFGGGVIDTKCAAYKDAALSALDECMKKDVVFELNYGAVQRGYLSRPYPEDYILSRIAEKDGKIIASTDCHSVKGISFGLDTAEEYLRAAGFKEITVMKDGEFVQKKL